jgi:hypothetical protein
MMLVKSFFSLFKLLIKAFIVITYKRVQKSKNRPKKGFIFDFSPFRPV